MKKLLMILFVLSSCKVSKPCCQLQQEPYTTESETFLSDPGNYTDVSREYMRRDRAEVLAELAALEGLKRAYEHELSHLQATGKDSISLSKEGLLMTVSKLEKMIRNLKK